MTKKKMEEKVPPMQSCTDVLSGGGIPRTKSKVAIVGFADSSMRDVQFLFDDPDLEVWALNQLYIPFPEIAERADRWFQIHARTSYDQTIARDHSHHEWLAKQTKFPIYMQKQEPDIPMSVPFPKDGILQHFRKYFTNSISWEIALAIAEGFKTIYLYGVDMANETEYQYERPSVEYFLGYAEGHGIKLVLPEKSDLLKAFFLYPFEDDSAFKIKIDSRCKELRDRESQADAQINNLTAQKYTLMGARENMRYVEKAWWDSLRGFEGMSPLIPPKGIG